MPDTAARPGRLELDADRLRALDDWTLPHYARLRDELSRQHAAIASQRNAMAGGQQDKTLDLEQLGELDTAGAALLVELLGPERSEEHTSELQSRGQLVCRLLL